MNATVREWIAKAEADFEMASHELATSPRPNFDGICFHAQQCVEKLLKGLLIQRGVDPPRTHNLIRLDELLRPVCPEWIPSIDDLRYLTQAGGAFRYPGAIAEPEDARYALQLCGSLRKSLLSLLEQPGLPNLEP